MLRAPRFCAAAWLRHFSSSVSLLPAGKSACSAGGRPLRSISFSVAAAKSQMVIGVIAACVGETPNTPGRAESREKWMTSFGSKTARLP